MPHPLFGKFRGIARKAWYNNNLFFHELAPTLGELRTGGIEMLVLYGGAMALKYDSEYVLSHGGTFTLLLRAGSAQRVYSTLVKGGWEPTPQISERALDRYLFARYFTAFQNKQGGHLVLQWQLLPHCTAQDTDGGFWRDAQAVEMDGVPLLAPDPTAQLLSACLYGNSARGSGHWQRVAETLLFLRAAATQVVWERLVLLAKEQRVILPVREILIAAQSFAPSIPASVINTLNALPISPTEAGDLVIWNAGTRQERRKNCGASRRGVPVRQVPCSRHSAFRPFSNIGGDWKALGAPSPCGVGGACRSSTVA